LPALPHTTLASCASLTIGWIRLTTPFTRRLLHGFTAPAPTCARTPGTGITHVPVCQQLAGQRRSLGWCCHHPSACIRYLVSLSIHIAQHGVHPSGRSLNCVVVPGGHSPSHKHMYIPYIPTYTGPTTQHNSRNFVLLPHPTPCGPVLLLVRDCKSGASDCMPTAGTPKSPLFQLGALKSGSQSSLCVRWKRLPCRRKMLAVISPLE
jgi:hypothetical protein